MKTRQTWVATVTARVRQAIKDTGLTEEFVGEQAGIPNSTLSRGFNHYDRYPFNLSQLEAIAGVIGMSPSDFLPESWEVKARGSQRRGGAA